MSAGGKRLGAGRPKGCNAYGEPTKPLRIPLSRIKEIKTFLGEGTNPYLLPLYSSKVPAGFPSPADDHIEMTLDLNTHLIKHPAATFFVRASGDSMIDVGIHSGDLLIVDRSLSAAHGSIVIAALEGSLTVKRLFKNKDKVQLLPENPAFSPIDIGNEQDLIIWGVVTHVIHETN